MSNVQLLGSKTFDSHIPIHCITQKNDVSLDKKIQKYHDRSYVFNQNENQTEYKISLWCFQQKKFLCNSLIYVYYSHVFFVSLDWVNYLNY